MPCRQVPTYGGVSGSGKAAGGGHATEADCLQACQEGACCEGTTCTVRPQCQCQGTGKVFKGVGTVCTAETCPCIGACCGPSPHFYYAGRYECAQITQAACAAKGGNWSGCNTGCPATDEVNVPTDRGCASFNPLP